MTKTYSAASIYGIIDRMDDAAIAAWLNWHRRLKYPPRFINVFTAARFNDAPNLLRRVRASLPETTPVWRGYDGRDAWGNPANPEWTDANYYINLWNRNATSAQMAAGMWFERRVKPFVEVIRETGTIVHLLNEAQPLFNAPFETECIRILGEEGIRAGAFAWAAGTPDWPDYQTQVIQDEVAMAAKYNAVVMTHEYCGLKPEEQNSLINRNQTLVKMFPKAPGVFLGEFALAKASISNGKIDLDPDVGWREMGVSEAQYFDFISSTATLWYVKNKVSFSLYSGPDWGKNGSFGIMKATGLLDELEEASEWMMFDVEENLLHPPTPAPVEIVTRPADAKDGIRARVKSIPSVFQNLRQSWDFRSAKMGELKVGDVVRKFDTPLHSGFVAENSMGNWIYVEKLDGDTPDAKVVAAGYVWTTRISWETLNTKTGEVPVVKPVDPPPQPAQPPAPSATAKRYSITIETTEDRHRIIEQTVMAMLTSVIYFGQVMAGVNVTVDSSAI